MIDSPHKWPEMEKLLRRHYITMMYVHGLVYVFLYQPCNIKYWNNLSPINQWISIARFIRQNMGRLCKCRTDYFHTFCVFDRILCYIGECNINSLGPSYQQWWLERSFSYVFMHFIPKLMSANYKSSCNFTQSVWPYNWHTSLYKNSIHMLFSMKL